MKYSFQLIFLESIFEFTINRAPQASNGVYGRENCLKCNNFTKSFIQCQPGPVVWEMHSRAGGRLLCSFKSSHGYFRFLCTVFLNHIFNWAACSEPSLRNGFHFFSGGRREYFLVSRGGVSRAPHLMFTLFQSNIYKVHVRELLSREKTGSLLKTSCPPQLTFGSPI